MSPSTISKSADPRETPAEQGDSSVNSEAIPPELPNAASPLPDHQQRRERPLSTKGWIVPLVAILVLMILAIVYSLYVRPFEEF